MDIYELISKGVEVGLLTMQVAQVLYSYIKKDDKQSKIEKDLQKVIEEALIYFKEQNHHENYKEPFSNINLLNEFMTTAQNISDPSIQELCNQIMAHEFASPGVTPQRIMQILSIISYEDMKKFQIICSMNIGIITEYNNPESNSPNADKRIMIPFNVINKDYKKTGICLKDINELQALGLITYSHSGYSIDELHCKHPLIYANGKTFYVLWHHRDKFPIGNVLLTKAGECLSNVINECEIIDEYSMYVREYMEEKGVDFAEQNKYSVIKTDGWFTLETKNRYHN